MIIELFSDEELSSVLGDPHEYQNIVYGGNGSEWCGLSSLSPLQFPESVNENEAHVGHMLPLLYEELERPDNSEEDDELQNDCNDIPFSMV